MERGRRGVEVLGERLEKVRGKVEECERLEGEWRDKMRRRVRWLWGCSCTVLGFFVVLLFIRHWPRAKEMVVPPVVGFGNLTIGKNLTVVWVQCFGLG